jgi:hypothetical protein
MTNLLQENIERRPTAQIAYLVFADTQNANQKNQKSYFFQPHSVDDSPLYNSQHIYTFAP